MNSKSFKASQSSLSSSSDFQEMQNLNNNNGNKPPMPPPSVTFGRRTSSGRYVNYSRDSRDDLDSEIGSGEFMNYTVHIPPTPDNQPMDPSISQKVEEQYVSNSLFTGGFNNVTRAHLMDKVIESEINHPQMAGSKGSSCAVPGCDGKVMSDERGLDILPCECDFKICRDCYVDAVKTGNGICPGCKEPYHNTDLDELARDSGRPLPLPPPGAGGISLSRDDLDSEIGSGEFMNYERSGRIRKSVQLRSGFLGRLNDEEDDDHPFAEEHKRAKFNTSTVLQWVSLYLILGALLSTLTTQLLVFISSQLLLVAFILRNTCKTVFEGIFFLFVMHPFDVGDLCEIEGVQMIVEEMNILDTVFLSFDNQKIIYPNNVLSTKPIRKCYRSPDMGDAIDY